MPRYLPSLLALRSFEAAARHESIKKGADELCVTPSAVSHQIQKLEEELGVRLFQRSGRNMLLTDTGAIYLAKIRRAFDGIADATIDASDIGSTDLLTIAVSPSLLHDWMIPRLRSFTAEFPDITLRLVDTLRLSDFAEESIDAAIVYGFQDPPNLKCEWLMNEKMIAVCSPDFLTQIQNDGNGVDSERCMLLDSERHPMRWSNVVESLGMKRRKGEPHRIRFLHSMHAVKAARDGVGIALTNAFNVVDDLTTGRLVILTATDVIPMSIDNVKEDIPRYFFACPIYNSSLPKVQVFGSWLKRQIDSTQQQLDVWSRSCWPELAAQIT